MMKKVILILVCIFLVSVNTYATHNKSGEITFVQIGEYTIECTVTTYTNIVGSNVADRDSLEVSWGDGMSETIARINGIDFDNNGVPNGEQIANGIKENKYVKTHVYANFGEFIISMTDPNRNAGIANINNGMSVDISFHLETAFTLSSETNNSPIALIKPIDIGSIGESYIHIPNAYDVDGDSLSYRLITPLADINEPVPGYESLQDISNNAGTSFEFNEETGLLIWDTPTIPGEYTVAIEILSYRNGIQNGRLIRDMQIVVSFMEMMKPVLEIANVEENIINDVEIGDMIEFQISLENENGLDIELFVSSELIGNSTNNVNVDFINENSAVFSWTVEEQNVRPQPFNIVVGARTVSGIANYKLLRYSTKSSWNNVNTVDLKEHINVFPNPCVDFCNIEIVSELPQTRKYYMMNSIGKEVESGEIIFNKRINTSSLKTGLYVIYIENTAPFLIIKK